MLSSSGGIVLQLLYIFFILNIFIYFKSSRWRKQQNLHIQHFTFIMDYFIFIIPIGTLLLLLSYPSIFIVGNSALDTVMKHIFIIELYLLGLPALLLCNFHIVYPNLQFICSLYNKKKLNYKVFKRGLLCLEVILCFTLIPSIHYIVIIFLGGISLFLEYQMADYF